MRLALFLLAALAATAYALWTYRRRELPVGGRWALAALRAGSFLVVLLLLFDPSLPAVAGGGSERWVLVDASASMAVGPAGATPWDSAGLRARVLRDQGARVLRFGGEPPAPPRDSALAVPPDEPRSLLVPALERAAEAGAREVVVVSDLRLEDPVGVRAALGRLGLAARFERVGGNPRSAGVAALELPADLSAGQPVLGQVTLFASGVGPGDSLRVQVREEERLVWSGVVPAPSEGRTVSVPLRLPAPTVAGESGEEVRYRAEVALEGDAFAVDDEGVAYAVVDPREGALVAVSFAPDWELRHLLPLLERVTGLPARGYLQTGARFFPLVSGEEPAPSIDDAEMSARVRDAQMVVLHGVRARAPAWAIATVGRAPRAVVFASDPETALAAGLRVGAPRAGEWYLDAEAGPSPLAGELAGLALQRLPPLLEMLPGAGLAPGQAPLSARFRGAGAADAPLVLREAADRRTAVVLGSGWWRWALRSGEPEEAYARLWSAVAGWLLAGGPAPAQRLQPTARVVAAGEPVEWTGSVRAARLTVLTASGDSVRVDTTLAPSSEPVRTPALAAGSYRYRAVSEGDTTGGRFDVRAPASELRHPPMDVPERIPPPPGRGTEPGERRPLRAHPAPYLVLLGLLCAEWIVRRRKGLR
jgi:hypothetical protein